jgi:hypothetical protein
VEFSKRGHIDVQGIVYAPNAEVKFKAADMDLGGYLGYEDEDEDEDEDWESDEDEDDDEDDGEHRRHASGARPFGVSPSHNPQRKQGILGASIFHSPALPNHEIG